MGVKYRTDGPWGPGLGMDLAPADVDTNFWQLTQDVAAKAEQGVGISNFVVNGGQMTVVLSDHSLLGPYPLPVAAISFAGEWFPDTEYLANAIITHGGSTYIVLINHTSAATFDPGAHDGSGNEFYGLLLQNPALSIPAGGAIGMTLFKATAVDYSIRWDWSTLAGLNDVLPSPPPSLGDLVYWNGAAFSYVAQTDVVGPPPNLTDLSDVAASPAPRTGDVVYWNGGAFSYLPQASINAAVPDLAALGDVLASPAPADGQAVIWSSSAGAFTYGTPSSSVALTNLTDVSIAVHSFALRDRDALFWDAASSLWVNRPVMTFTSWGFTSSTIGLGQQYNLLDTQAGATTLTIPLSTSTPFAVSAIFGVRQSSSSRATIVAASGVTLNVPPGKQAKTRAYGSVIWAQQTDTIDTWALYGDLADAPTALPAAGTWTVDPRVGDSSTYTWTPSANNTVNLASGASVYGTKMIFIITTAGTTSYNLTFGTGFKSQGVLATGTVSGKVFTVSFVGDGVNYNEVSRTTAM